MGVSQNYQESQSGPTNFYGPMTPRVPGRLFRSFINPLTLGFGVGGYPAANRFQSRMGSMNGPLADYIRQVGDMSGSIIPQAQTIGRDIAQRAPMAFGQLQDQITGALGSLPGLQKTGQGGVDRAQWLVDQAFS